MSVIHNRWFMQYKQSSKRGRVPVMIIEKADFSCPNTDYLDGCRSRPAYRETL